MEVDTGTCLLSMQKATPTISFARLLWQTEGPRKQQFMFYQRSGTETRGFGGVSTKVAHENRESPRVDRTPSLAPTKRWTSSISAGVLTRKEGIQNFFLLKMKQTQRLVLCFYFLLATNCGLVEFSLWPFESPG